MSTRHEHFGLTLLLSAGLGLLAGMRSMAVPAILSRFLASRREHTASVRDNANGGDALVRLLSRPGASTALTGMAAGEMLTDKMPFAPNRTDAPSLLGRTAIGAVSGMAVAVYRSDRAWPSALVGAAAAYGSTHVSFHLRRMLREGTFLPDPILGVLEDVFVLRAGKSLIDLLDGELIVGSRVPGGRTESFIPLRRIVIGHNQRNPRAVPRLD